jgi:hypothetical protein
MLPKMLNFLTHLALMRMVKLNKLALLRLKVKNDYDFPKSLTFKI